MSENAVIFKGTKEGLYVIIKESLDFDAVKDNLSQKIKPSKRFFEGAKIVNFKGKQLTREQFDELKGIMEQEYGMVVTGSYLDKTAEVSAEKDEIKEVKENEYLRLPYDDVSQKPALFVRATVRSGQLIDYDGNIIIVGDVNPGAHIRASGNIVIMGNMRGVAHAGKNGDYGAYIAAFSLQPMQLRIGDIITRSPDGLVIKPNTPEMAMVKHGGIVVEPYLPNK